jgi:hypothetical protein
MAALAVMTTLGDYGRCAGQRTVEPGAQRGYGSDPDLNHPTVPWARTMSAQQRQMTAVLADLLLPGTDAAPAPSALGIADFVDEWISAPYPEQRADRRLVLEGFGRLDAQAQSLFQRDFLAADEAQQRQLFASLIPPDGVGRSLTPFEDNFFRRFRYLIVGGYYTTPEGCGDIGYVGNVPLTSYAPVSEQERAILDEELRKLGIER